MQVKWDRFKGITAAIGLLIMIFDSSRALAGARSGLELCIKTVIPSLFPFFVLSAIFTSSCSNNSIHFAELLAKPLGIPKNGISVMIPALMGGYPVGAKCIGDLYRQKSISKSEAERLLSFCNNAGPAFLFGMVSGFFPKKQTILLLWMIQLSSAVLTALAIPYQPDKNPLHPPDIREKQANVMIASAKAMCQVCCWVILFRIIITFLEGWCLWLIPDRMQPLWIGFLELTNGCCELWKIEDIATRFIVCSCILAFGGICVLLQTASVIQGLPISCYFKGKILQTLFSFLLSCAIVLDNGLIYAAIIPVLLFVFRKSKNKYSNPGVLPV